MHWAPTKFVEKHLRNNSAVAPAAAFGQRGSLRQKLASATQVLILAALSAPLLIGPQPAHAATDTVLYSFTGANGDGYYPASAVIMDSAGNLYGTTVFGGANGDGTVFKLSPSGAETILHSFTGTNGDGANPSAGLVMDNAGNLHGTTQGGGATGGGSVFKVTKARPKPEVATPGSR